METCPFKFSVEWSQYTSGESGPDTTVNVETTGVSTSYSSFINVVPQYGQRVTPFNTFFLQQGLI